MTQTKSSWVDFKALKAKVSIVQILERYGILQSLIKSGDRLSGGCPIHGGSNKTHFRVSVSKNCWNCFGACQSGGNIIDFVEKKEGVTFRDAAMLIQEWFCGEPAGSVPALAEEPSVETVPAGEGFRYSTPNAEADGDESDQEAENKPLSFELSKLDPTHPYLRERGLTEATIETFGVGYCGKGLLRGHIAIPIHSSQGHLVAFAGRLVAPSKDKPKYKLPRGFRKSLELFNYHRAIASEQEAPVVVVEGFFDAMMLHQAGYEKVVALMGSSLSERQEELLDRLCEVDERLILFLDPDEAGQNGLEEMRDWLSRRLYVRAIHLDKGGPQPGDIPPDELRLILPFQKEWSRHE